MRRLVLRSSVLLAAQLCGAAALAQTPLFVFDGDPGDRLGFSVASVGDLDGDGRAEVIAGAYQDNEGGINGGTATVFSGASGAPLFEVVGGVGAWLGSAVAGAGDVNQDGTPDFVTGMPNVDRARVFSGLNGAELYTFDGADTTEFGKSVAGAGDVNADGYADVIVGGPFTGTGYANVYSGFDGSLLHAFTGEKSFEGFGTSVAGVGDIDQDGSDDVAIGSPTFGQATSTGLVRVHSGATGAELWRWRGPIQAWAGQSVAAAGDIDGDSVPDVIVGAPEVIKVGGAGQAFVISGANGQAIRSFAGDSPDDEFGHSVGGLGDFDGDGVPDVVVGAWLDDDNGLESGSARVFSGASGNEITTYYGEAADDHFGGAVAGAGQVNADGSGELVVGAFRNDVGGNNAGRVYVYAGSCFGALGNYCTAGVSASGCQATLAATGTASATASSGFVLSAADVEGLRNGAFFYGTGGRQANAWGNGTSLRCVVPPVRRLGTMSGTGTAGACDGAFALDLNALWCPTCPKPGVNPGSGAVAQAQLWYRDPQNTSNQPTSLSDAMEFVICP
jgi:hypothetical protein